MSCDYNTAPGYGITAFGFQCDGETQSECVDDCVEGEAIYASVCDDACNTQCGQDWTGMWWSNWLAGSSCTGASILA
jgi:hypothetical protein